MRRRDFIAGLAAAAWPVDVRAQRAKQGWRIAILWRGNVTEGVVQAQQGALLEELAKLGWSAGPNVQFDIRYSTDDPARMRTHADELVGLGPDVIAASSFAVARAVLQRTQTIPVVFINVGDPVVGGLLKNIARPEGNATGVTSYYRSLGGKLLELLKEAAPRTTRAALIFDRANVNDQFFDEINTAAGVLSVKAVRAAYRNEAELQRAIAAFAAEANGALLMVPPPPAPANGELINRLAVMYRLPTIYSSRFYVVQGGMMSYGAPIVDSYRIAATYVDKILRGAKMEELPVQFPTRIELAINLKTVKALGLTIPPNLLAVADEVIE
jgi:putative tryptophan/tyrosine transport system substrate-binding protein